MAVTAFDILHSEGESRRFVAGQIVFSEGDSGDFMYIVVDGELEVRLRDRVVDVVRQGVIAGEMALIDRQPRSATVVARTDCSLIRVDSKGFQRLVQQMPYFALQVMRTLSDRLRRQNAAR